MDYFAPLFNACKKQKLSKRWLAPFRLQRSEMEKSKNLFFCSRDFFPASLHSAQNGDLL